ncbi:MAG: metallophosphoesterase [Balneolaceae bacterium]|nr:metallophosphoesterase [Balneolaceae bacterium]
MKTIHILWLFLIAGIVACNTSELYISEENSEHRLSPPPESDLFYSLFLVGDAGGIGTDTPNPVLQLLQSKAAEAGEQSTILFLGDNIYPAGLPAKEAKGRKQAESRLLAQLQTVKDHPGQVYFIPGNHDWNDSKAGGLEAVNRQEEFVEMYLDRGNTFLPDYGFPGPVDIELVNDDDTPFGKDIRLIILDTEWWLSRQEKPYGDTGEYDLQDADDFLVELDDIVRKRQNDHMIIAAHHPLYSNGRHGGYFPADRHLVPPVFGSLYVVYRKFFGYSQDISHYRYQLLKREVESSIGNVPNLIYASGHEHSLQYFRVKRRRFDQHFVVSGSGSRDSYVKPGMGAEFTYRGAGLQVVRYYKDGSSWLESWAPDASTGQGRLVYRTRMGASDENPFYELDTDSLQPIPNLQDSTVTVAANSKYDEKSTLYRTFLGFHNRELWGIPVNVPVFDIGSVEGGLEAVKLGGKGQSNSLRLQRSDGRDYVLRSVDKEAGKIWDDHLKNTIAHDLAQDQFSILNPYGAFMVPPLADAIGIYHTNPKLYYIPHDYRLGEFANQAGSRLALFEERPDGNMSDAPHFGNSEEVISTHPGAGHPWQYFNQRSPE